MVLKADYNNVLLFQTTKFI